MLTFQMRSVSRWALGCLLVAMIVVTSGCNVFKKFHTPVLLPLKVTAVNVNLHERSAEGASYVITVELENPNDVDLPLKDCQYSLSVGDSKSNNLSINPKRTLPANGTQMVRMTASIPEGGNGAYRASGTITFEPPGEIRKILTESKVPLPFVSFNGEGQL